MFASTLKQYRRPAGLAMAGAAMLLAGCASMLGPTDSPAWYESQKPTLTERAEGRWKARIAGDIQAEYGYLSPSYRDVVSKQQYQARIGREVDWLVARVGDIRYDSPTVASVMVEVTYRIFVQNGTEVKSVQVSPEKWLYIDGGWWYTSK